MHPFFLSAVLLLVSCTPPQLQAPSSSAREGYFPGAEGESLYYQAIGGGPDTVVVVHGFQGNGSSYLAPDLQRLADGRTLLVYDQRGEGRSDSVQGLEHPGLEEHVRDLEALRRHFGLERLRLFGHSGGAAIVVHYAGVHPQHVERALLVAPPPLVGAAYGELTGQRFFARLDSATWARMRALEARIAQAEDPAVVCREIIATTLPRAFLADSTALGRMRGDFCGAPPDRLRTRAARRDAFLRSQQGRDWHPILERIRVPVLIIHGEQDAIPAESARELARALPDGRVLILPLADHLPWLDQPIKFFSAADAFFRGICRGGHERVNPPQRQRKASQTAREFKPHAPSVCRSAIEFSPLPLAGEGPGERAAEACAGPSRTAPTYARQAPQERVNPPLEKR
ncbi:MAG TPA: alpha/beta hydrolase [Longimicrobium sp.]|jgi:pimeloyl-ACP methyl ester carboxylesterase|uniref:alpha/beta fold hydrolase n=1 Tax=Longimicrobium sp. TaxID=2029185 RepID=UPI002ED7A8E2